VRYEVIIADNGSVDNSVELVRSHYGEEVVLMEFGINHGFAKGNNIAAGEAKGELLVFLNQDTIVDRRWLSTLVGGIVDEGFDACHSNMLLPRNAEFSSVPTEVVPKKVYYYELNKFGYVSQVVTSRKETVIETRFLSGASFIIKSSVLNKMGYLFDESFGSYNEDMDLAFRLRQSGYKIGVVPSSIVYHLSSFSLEVSKYNVWKNGMMIRNRIIAFWKNQSPKEFLRFVPYLLISQSHKVFRRCRRIKYPFGVSLGLACSVFPMSLAGFALFGVWYIRSGISFTDHVVQGGA
jgi:GT2 family glycosyltransferase